jgi:RNA polymerase sigma-B factor
VNTTQATRATAHVDDAELSMLLRRLDRLPAGAERDVVIDEVVRLCMPAANAVATRYRNKGVPDEDLEQVAYLGLIKAAQRYDGRRAGEHFLSYAVPTMRGEVRRYFRDHGWSVRPTRALQELQPRLVEARDELHERLGRSPRPSEIAHALGESEETIIEALTLDGCYRPTSLDAGVGGEGGIPLAALLPTDDRSWGAMEARLVLEMGVSKLSERDRRILYLRFFEGWAQAEIAAELGISQMQVSRLLARILRNLRDSVGPVPAES